MPSVSIERATSCPARMLRTKAQLASATRMGAGATARMPGQRSQVSKYALLRKGVARLTIAMAANVAPPSHQAMARACRCSRPSAFITSQVAPSSA